VAALALIAALDAGYIVRSTAPIGSANYLPHVCHILEVRQTEK
jgi:hypothetical protein